MHCSERAASVLVRRTNPLTLRQFGLIDFLSYLSVKIILSLLIDMQDIALQTSQLLENIVALHSTHIIAS